MLKARGLRRSRVLELGAGTGLAGLVAVAWWKDGFIVMVSGWKL